MLLNYFLVILLLTDYCFGTFFGGGGGGGGCGCGGGCAPPPVCAPQACPQVSCPPVGGGGYYSGGYSSGQPISAAGYSSGQPVSAGGYYATSPGAAVVPLPVQPGTGYLTSASAAQTPLKTTAIKTRYSSSTERDKDFYDEPPPDLKVADVSAESKELHATDIFKRRYLMLKNLRHRHLRQLSAPSLPIPSSNVCNNEKLARIMAKSIVTDISISKRLIRKATEISFNGLKFDVICAQGDFSYSIYAEQYCETTRGNVTCFAFT